MYLSFLFYFVALVFQVLLIDNGFDLLSASNDIEFYLGLFCIVISPLPIFVCYRILNWGKAK